MPLGDDAGNADRPDAVSRYVGAGAVADRLAGMLCALRPDHVPRVAIDGPDAAGKTTLADRLASRIQASRPVIRLCADDFGYPPATRYRHGSLSPLGYYLDSFDHAMIAADVLEPLGPGGDRAYRLARDCDQSREVPVPGAAEPAHADSPASPLAGSPADSVASPRRRHPAARHIADPRALLLFDGVFLQRAQLREHWDFVVYLDVAPEESLRRALVRDLPVLGSHRNIERRYRLRYLPGQAIYRLRDRPAERADVVLDMAEPARPRITALRTPRAGAHS